MRVPKKQEPNGQWSHFLATNVCPDESGEFTGVFSLSMARKKLAVRPVWCVGFLKKSHLQPFHSFVHNPCFRMLNIKNNIFFDVLSEVMRTERRNPTHVANTYLMLSMDRFMMYHKKAMDFFYIPQRVHWITMTKLRAVPHTHLH